jgi:bifunctional DNA-binding transcriptional regulator/antitoxin component of YhaV-PrlF toxin-antitoxin module
MVHLLVNDNVICYSKDMNKVITITRKGQTTLPITMRQKLGIGPAGGTLRATFNERTGQLVISKRLTVAEVSARVSRSVKPGTRPLHDVDAYYQAHREWRGGA